MTKKEAEIDAWLRKNSIYRPDANAIIKRYMEDREG